MTEDILDNYFHKYVGKQKKFDTTLYNKYDIPLRELIKEKLKDNVKDNDNIYDQDLIINDKDCKYKFMELQVCTQWIHDKFPYNEPYIYERKIKFSKDTLYIISNRHMDKLLIFDRESVNAKPQRIKKFSRTFVYSVPWNRILHCPVESLDMDTINMY